MSRSDHSAELKLVVTNTLIVRDVQNSVAFYRDVLGATVLREGEPTFLRLGNVWLTINRGGGPTDDKPEVMASPPRDPNVLSIFLNLRVTDISHYYDLWSSRGAKFITEPKVHATELQRSMHVSLRCILLGYCSCTCGGAKLIAGRFLDRLHCRDCC